MHAPGRPCTSGSPAASGVVHIGQVDSTFLLAARDWNQVDVPPHCSALGKVLYAHGLLPLPGDLLEQPTEHALGTRAALVEDLSGVLGRGYAVTLDELETGLTGIAAPVEGREGVVCALGISGPTARLQDRVDHIGQLLVEQADALSDLLGRASRKHHPTPQPAQHRAQSPTKEGAA